MRERIQRNDEEKQSYSDEIGAANDIDLVILDGATHRFANGLQGCNVDDTIDVILKN